MSAQKIDLFHLYRHFAKDGTLLYVGRSLNAIFRLMQHFGVSSWAAEIAFIEIDRFESFECLVEAENQAILAENPLHNRYRPPSVPARERIKAERVKSARPRGRPPILNDRPWEIEGISRRTWYRKNKSTRFLE